MPTVLATWMGTTMDIETDTLADLAFRGADRRCRRRLATHRAHPLHLGPGTGTPTAARPSPRAGRRRARVGRTASGPVGARGTGAAR